jgi:crotonobetainyl-CoA:carnitine CoA-transferase CaiB-like acyl-CoA transferase
MSASALEGLRVVDLTRYIPGPYCTMLLGDLGADVIKVEEPPAGDPTRAVAPLVAGEAAVHVALNRNKRSVVVDLRQEAGIALVRRLAARADVLVEAFRPGVLERRGLGAEALRADNPRLVYCSISGYGREGPLAPRAGHDLDYAALGGLLADREAPFPTQLADMTGGLLAAFGILAALQARERTGRGQVVDVSLLEGVLALMSVPAARVLAGGSVANELTGLYACYNIYSCRDGRRLAVGALEPKFWERLCRALEAPELVARQWDPQQDDVKAALARILAARDRDEWLRRLAEVDACVEPVLELAEALGRPPLREAVVSQAVGAATVRSAGHPVRLSETPATTHRPAPELSAQADEVLAELGYAPADVAALRAQGVVA